MRAAATHPTEEIRPWLKGNLHDAFIDERRDTYDAGKQLTKALPKLAKAATNAKLRAAFETHLQETQGQIERLEQVFESLDEKVRGKHCDGIAKIIEEGKSIMEEDFVETTMDACLIAAGQRAEHYEMAAYGTLVAWAQAMGHTEAAKLLQQTLDEEKAADEMLFGLAEGGINQSAADSAHPEDDEEPVGRRRRKCEKEPGEIGATVALRGERARTGRPSRDGPPCEVTRWRGFAIGR
jgi:ferritin-like metal-binding protein YciE